MIHDGSGNLADSLFGLKYDYWCGGWCADGWKIITA